MQATDQYLWTLDRYHHAVNAGVFEDQKIELLAGKLIKMSPEGTPHAGAIRDLVDRLKDQLGKKAIVSDGHPVTLSPTSEPEPDIAVVQPLGKEYREHHPYPENIFWIIEFSNASLEKDLSQKRQLYAIARIPEYWVVNLRQKQVHVYRQPENEAFQWEMLFNSGTLSPEAFPDIVVDLSELF
ncbi:MAG: Uma2 family endonuclease [Microcoleaceae cyanobacterium]